MQTILFIYGDNMTKIDQLINELTLEEKACLLSGHKSWHTNKISRVDLPSIFLTDGPHGLRKKREDSTETGLGQTEYSTAFPTAVTSGSTWNKDLIYKLGEGMGKECNFYDVHLILGPAVNIKRNPLCGRSFEYFSEDPLISGLCGSALTRGIEDRGVGTSVKHYACNNNEKNRYFGDSIVDERAFREIYLKGFEHIVKKGKPATLMCAYNKVNGTYASENKKLLTDIPRGEWGFEGLIMSDWGAVNDRVAGLNAGLDLEMPGDILHNNQLIIDAVRDGRISEETLNTSVRRVLNMVYNGINGMRAQENPLDEDSILSGDISAEGAVLLKNENSALPLTKNGSYLVVGEMFEKMRYQGAGSSLLRPYKLITPEDAFNANHIDYDYAKGYNVSSPKIDEGHMFIALESAKNHDTIIFFGGLTEDAESEGFDRENMLIPENQRVLLEALCQLGKKVIFVMYGGSPVELDCAEKADAILNMYLPGQEGGRSTYELLFGEKSPSGRLTESWPYHYSDVPFGAELAKTTNDVYKESVFVGYRYYTTFGVPVRYPFGYGLSYTSFSYSNMSLTQDENGFIVTVNVKNDGAASGSEVVELFVESPRTMFIKPLRELRGFEKVHLAPGEEKTVTITVSREDMKYFANGQWRLENGEYKFQICKDANTVILEKSAEITDGENLETPEHIRALYETKDSLLAITDKDFEKVIGREITLKETCRPYDLNTPMRDYRSFGGRLLFGGLTIAFKAILAFTKMGKNSPDKETKIKNAYFGMKTIQAMSLRSLSYASEGLLTHRMAEGLLDIANNHFISGIKKLLTPEDCVKLPE